MDKLKRIVTGLLLVNWILIAMPAVVAVITLPNPDNIFLWMAIICISVEIGFKVITRKFFSQKLWNYAFYERPIFWKEPLCEKNDRGFVLGEVVYISNKYLECQDSDYGLEMIIGEIRDNTATLTLKCSHARLLMGGKVWKVPLEYLLRNKKDIA